jgi:hypothetical protein
MVVRDRSAAQASRIREIMARHHATRPRGTDDEEAA